MDLERRVVEGHGRNLHYAKKLNGMGRGNIVTEDGSVDGRGLADDYHEMEMINYQNTQYAGILYVGSQR